MRNPGLDLPRASPARHPRPRAGASGPPRARQPRNLALRRRARALRPHAPGDPRPLAPRRATVRRARWKLGLHGERRDLQLPAAACPAGIEGRTVRFGGRPRGRPAVARPGGDGRRRGTRRDVRPGVLVGARRKAPARPRSSRHQTAVLRAAAGRPRVRVPAEGPAGARADVRAAGPRCSLRLPRVRLRSFRPLHFRGHPQVARRARAAVRARERPVRGPRVLEARAARVSRRPRGVAGAPAAGRVLPHGLRRSRRGLSFGRARFHDDRGAGVPVAPGPSDFRRRLRRGRSLGRSLRPERCADARDAARGGAPAHGRTRPGPRSVRGGVRRAGL